LQAHEKKRSLEEVEEVEVTGVVQNRRVGIIF
jgi:hypothetical protein